jgi:type II secretory pathway component PulM
MTRVWDRLNLRPAERRLVVGVAVVLFIVLNAFLVWPHFKDWNQTKNRLYGAQEKLKTFHGQVNQTEDYAKRVRTLESSGGMAAEDQDIQLLRTIQMRAAESGVSIIQTPRPTAQTNEYFVEQVQSVSVQGDEEQLVIFLFNLGSSNSTVRVRDLSLRPDPPRQRLAGTIRLVASFPRKLGGRPTTRTGEAKSTTPLR